MRYLAFALALCFAVGPMEAATRHTATHKVKAKKNKKAPKAHKAKKPSKHTA